MALPLIKPFGRSASRIGIHFKCDWRLWIKSLGL